MGSLEAPVLVDPEEAELMGDFRGGGEQAGTEADADRWPLRRRVRNGTASYEEVREWAAEGRH